MVFYCYFKISYSAVLFASLAAMVQSSHILSEPPSIDRSACIGMYANLGDNVKIEANTKISDLVVIESHTVIHKNALIGKQTHIKERCTIGRNVFIGNRVKIGYQTTIADHSKVGRFTRIGDKCIIAPMVQIGEVVQIGNNNTIETGCIIRSISKITDNVIIDEMAIIEKLAEVSAEYVGKHAYIGMQTTVGPKTMIGDSAVILEAVVIPSHVIVLATEIVARTPTSLYFYRQCHDFILTDKTTTEFVHMSRPFDKRCPRTATDTEISPEFNQKIHDLIQNDLNTLNQHCSQSMHHRSQPQNLKKIIGLYLIQYHGIERVRRILAEIGNEGFVSHDNLIVQLLHEEQHFTDKAEKTILKLDVIEKFIQLLVIGQDAKRELRADGDLFCGMLHDIQNKRRNIIFADTDLISDAYSI